MELGIHPPAEGAGGHRLDVLGKPMPDCDLPPERYRERLLSAEEADEIGGKHDIKRIG